jgi:hypothetical protein
MVLIDFVKCSTARNVLHGTHDVIFPTVGLDTPNLIVGHQPLMVVIVDTKF